MFTTICLEKTQIIIISLLFLYTLTQLNSINQLLNIPNHLYNF